jgi:predicted RNA methylase
MSLHLPSQSFRDSYRWMGAPPLPYRPDGRIHPSRAAFEFYPTPPEATRALLSVEAFDGNVWEPACGRGHISKVLEAAGVPVVSTDLVQRDFGQGGVDFFRETVSRGKHIVTNPPYGRGLADDFVKHALELCAITDGKVAMLLNLSSLAHPIRHPLWVARPPAKVYVLDELVCWPEDDPLQATRATPFHRYCWVVWYPQRVTATELSWISTRRFKNSSES